MSEKEKFLGCNDVYVGDALDKLDKIRNNTVHLVVTSPPYNAGYNYDDYNDSLDWETYTGYLRKVITKIYDILVKGGRLAINVPFAIKHRDTKEVRFLATTIAGICNDISEEGKEFIEFEFITWHKGKNKKHFQGNNTAWGSWKQPSHPVFRGLGEVVMVFSKEQPRLPGNKEKADITAEEFKEWTKNLWYLDEEEQTENLWYVEGDLAYKNLWCVPNNQSKKNHPCPYPKELVRRLIKLYTYGDNLVLDPFNGVGTTTEVAQELGRRFIGIDQSERYCNIALDKLGLREE